MKPPLSALAIVAIAAAAVCADTRQDGLSHACLAPAVPPLRGDAAEQSARASGERAEHQERVHHLSIRPLVARAPAERRSDFAAAIRSAHFGRWAHRV